MHSGWNMHMQMLHDRDGGTPIRPAHFKPHRTLSSDISLYGILNKINDKKNPSSFMPHTQGVTGAITIIVTEIALSPHQIMQMPHMIYKAAVAQVHYKFIYMPNKVLNVFN